MQAIREFGIGEGGLLRRVEKAVGLTTLPRQIIAAVALTWVPVVALSLVNERLTGVREPLVHAPALHVRLLVTVPVLLTLDHVFPYICRLTLRQLVSQGFLPDAVQERFDRMLRSTTHLADSLWPELLLAGLAFGLGIAAMIGVIPGSAFRHGGGGLTAAHVWYALADWPVLQFLLWRSLWRWAIWVRVLFALSRFDLALLPPHPDRCGGICFLRLPSIGYCATLLFAISAVLCSDQSSRFAPGMSLVGFAPLLAVFATAGTLIAFGPLLLFVPMLVRLRGVGRIQYTELASAYGRGFQRQWIERPDPTGRLGAGDTQPLADLAVIYRETIDRLRWLLFGKRDMVVLLIATLLPMVPIMLLHVPEEDWRWLIGPLSGGLLL